MKSFKLELNEKVEENISRADMKNIIGGHDEQIEFWGSRLFCSTEIPGDCSKSKSCSGAWVCIPLGF